MIVRERTAGFLVLIVVLSLPACTLDVTSGENPERPREVRVRGRLERSGMTSYMYGTHVIVDRARRQRYALRGEGVDLDAYLGQQVELVGNRLHGYPVDGGPPYLAVHTVHSFQTRGDSDE